MLSTVHVEVHSSRILTPTVQKMFQISASYGGEYDEYCRLCIWIQSHL